MLARTDARQERRPWCVCLSERALPQEARRRHGLRRTRGGCT